MYLMTGIEKWIKVTILYFCKYFLLSSKWGKWGIFGPKSLFSSCSLNLFIRLFWNCTKNIEKWVKVTVSRKKSDSQKRAHFWAQNEHFRTFL